MGRQRLIFFPKLVTIGMLIINDRKKEADSMRKAHPHGVQGRRPIAPKYKRALKEKKIEEIRKWAKEKPADEK